MKKKLLLILLTVSMITVFTACSSNPHEEDDPGANKAMITAAESETINNYLNQYNLDAENPVTDDDLTDISAVSATLNIGDVEAIITDQQDGNLLLQLKFDSLSSLSIDPIIRDLIIAEAPDMTYDTFENMMDALRQTDGTDSEPYELDAFNVTIEQGDGGGYQMTVRPQ